MSLITIITPVFNKERYIAAAIESVINQSFKDIEYVIVDDGSTDSSPDIIDEYAKKDSRIKVIHQNNQWIYASFNNGVREATSQYVYILNADDKIREGALDNIANVIKEYNPDVIWTKVLMHKADCNQNIIAYDYENWNEKVKSDSYQDSNVSVRNSWVYISQSLLNLNQANVYKRDLIIKHPFRNDVYAADTFFNIDIARDINSSYILSTPVYDFYEYVDKQNASIGKYYDYEHNMFNELYIKQKYLIESWGMSGDEYKKYISRKRLINLSIEFKNVLYHYNMNTEDKIKEILNNASDSLVKEAVNNINAESELERRILFAISNVIEHEGLPDDSEYSFFKELITVLAQQRNIIDNIERITNSTYNVYKVGKFFDRELENVSSYIRYYFKK